MPTFAPLQQIPGQQAAPQQYAPMPQAPMQQAAAPVENPGEVALPPAPQSPPGRPAWPAYQPPQQQQAQPQPQQQYQPQAPNLQQQFAPAQQYPQQPQYQQPQQPAAPAPQPQSPFNPNVMAHDPRFQQAAQTQFNDGLTLAGPVGGGFGGPTVPAGQNAPVGYSAYPAGVPNTPPAQQPAPEAPTTSTVVRDSLIRQGLAVGQYQSDEELLADFSDGLNEMQQLRQMAAYGQQAMARDRSPTGSQPAAPGASPSSAQPTAPAEPQRPAAPEWRQEWARLVTLDNATGLYRAVDPMAVNPQIVEKANQYADWQRQRSEMLVRSPLEVLKQEGLDALIEERLAKARESWQQETRAEAESRDAASQVSKFVESNKAAFYQLGADGNPVVNPITRQYIVTPRGAAAQQAASEYRQSFTSHYGFEPNAEHLISHVQMTLAAGDARGAWGPPPVPQQPNQYQQPGVPQNQPYAQQYIPPQQQVPQGPSRNELMKDQVIQRAIAMNGAQYQPNQLGTVASAAANATLPQNPNVDFTTMLRQEAQRRGLIHPIA